MIDNLIDRILGATNIYCDTETCGFHGMPVLLQLGFDQESDDDIVLYEFWKEPFSRSLRVMEAMSQRNFIGFNLAFDTFHVCKAYTVFAEVLKNHPELGDANPEDHIDLCEKYEEAAMDGDCWKPLAACDLMLHGRKNQFQTLMNRGDIRIRKVPTALAYVLAEELERVVEIPDIYFAKFKKNDGRWRVYDRDDEDGGAYFKDVCLKFNPSAGLKYLAEFALGLKPKSNFTDIELDPVHRPNELGYAPTARAAREYFPEGKAWPDVIHHHIEHWHKEEDAREYAKDDIVYTRGIHAHFGYPEPGDDDSELACMVAAVRWRGFRVDLDGIEGLRVLAQKVVDSSPVNVNSVKEVRAYLEEVMDETEKIIILESTNKAILEEIETWTGEDDNPEAAARASKLLKVKTAVKEIELYTKVLLAKRLHADMNVIGTKSSRMSGGGGLNAQGIKHAKFVRECFPMADESNVLSLGDFSAFEITLADAVYDDPDIRKALRSGKKIHAYFGTLLFPGKTYDDIIASDGTENDMYTVAKSCVFALLFGGNAFTLHRQQGIPIEVAENAIEQWGVLFPGIAAVTARIEERFRALVQNETGQITYSEPEDYVETLDGHKRYFTLENMVAKELYDLANSPPKGWRDCKIKVARRDRLQTASGAVRSALYGAAFSIQGSNCRAALNHEIQSLGGTLCKRVQRKLWNRQPHGVHPFKISLINVHDEILAVTPPDEVDSLGESVREAVEAERDLVPMVGMKWIKNADSWAGKKGQAGADEINISPPMLEPNEVDSVI